MTENSKSPKSVARGLNQKCYSFNENSKDNPIRRGKVSRSLSQGFGTPSRQRNSLTDNSDPPQQRLSSPRQRFSLLRARSLKIMLNPRSTKKKNGSRSPEADGSAKQNPDGSSVNSGFHQDIPIPLQGYREQSLNSESSVMPVHLSPAKLDNKFAATDPVRKLKAYTAFESSPNDVANESISCECAICLEVMEDSTTMLPCQHRFHTECLNNRWWCVRGNECPLCRAPVPEPPKKMSYQDAKKRYLIIQRRVATRATSWESLSDAERDVIKEAMLVWRNTAEKGGNNSCVAQFDLGVVYSKGHGVERDYSEAVRWYTMAAKQGHMSSQYNLGNMYRNGQGVAPNEDIALDWYQIAADQGHEAASFNLQKMMKKSPYESDTQPSIQPCMFAFFPNISWGLQIKTG